MLTEQTICKSQNGELENEMREFRKIRVGIREMGWECGCFNTDIHCHFPRAFFFKHF